MPQKGIKSNETRDTTIEVFLNEWKSILYECLNVVLKRIPIVFWRKIQGHWHDLV